jgi:hypothetical protein
LPFAGCRLPIWTLLPFHEIGNWQPEIGNASARVLRDVQQNANCG